MSESNLILEHLRVIREDISVLKDDMWEVKQRISNIESHIALLYGDFSNQSQRMDRLD